jgi:hypothetical protein
MFSKNNNVYNVRININYIFILYVFNIMVVNILLYFFSNLIKFDFNYIHGTKLNKNGGSTYHDHCILSYVILVEAISRLFCFDKE